MAKATLEFDLDIPSDNMEFSRAIKATDMALALFEIQMNTKRSFEHDDEHNNKTLNAVFDEIYRILNEYSINTETLLE